VAIVDYNANGPQSYQSNWPAIAGVLDSLKVTTTSAASAAPAPAAKVGTVDGLYLASTRRLQLRIGGPPGSGEWVIDTRFYLLSADGRFHRGYGLPPVPGGDVRRFDYAEAERRDAPNTGTFTVKGGQVQLKPRSGDAATGTVTGDELRIENMTFKKAALK
jgi:hypothetical protein